VVDARTVDIQEAEVWLADAVRLAVAVDERAAAVELAAYAETLPSQDDIPHRKGAALHCRGLLDADPGLLFDAADCYTAASRPFPRAQALEAAAALLAERGEVASAKVPCISAMDGYVALGAAWDLTRARARFRRYGLRQPTRRRKRPATGWEALTPAEARVAELVAQGLSNPEIAKELVVARPTVGYHVTKVLAKLQVRSRIDVARAAAVRSQQAAP
jgi:DNA-binding CsgD family transcriptional regulator